jgi:ketosteroid isomerase-like protein
MSQANVELVRTVCTPWERGDFGSAEWAHHDIEFAFADGPTPGTWTGVAAMNDAWREALTAFEGLVVRVEQYLQLDDERVLVLMHNTGHGKASGFDLGQLENRGANLFHVREGKVTKLVLYFDRARALEAVGLSD